MAPHGCFCRSGHFDRLRTGFSREFKGSPLSIFPPQGERAREGENDEEAGAAGNAARAKDGQGVIIAFQKLQTSCYSCHSEFRKPFVEHFYGRKDAVQ